MVGPGALSQLPTPPMAHPTANPRRRILSVLFTSAGSAITFDPLTFHLKQGLKVKGQPLRRLAENGLSTFSSAVSWSPTRVDAPPPANLQKKHAKHSGLGLGSGGGRPSTSGNRRRTQVLSKGPRPSSVLAGQASHKRSSVYGQGVGSQPKKDPRPLSDKAHQLASIKKLIAFLADRSYGKPFTVKQLQQPSTKEFLHIFNFMVTMIDPALEVNGMTIVEDVPKTLKLLGYPFTVSKNHMLNVGSPHAWPILLGALSWLVEACVLPDRTVELMFPSESGFDDDEMSAKEIPVLAARSEENQQRIAVLQERVEGELTGAIEAVGDEITALQGSQSDIEMQTTASLEKSKELEDQIRRQPMSAKDARDLRQSIADTEHTLGKHRKMQQQNTERVEELQMQHNRSVSLIDSACRKANDKLHRLSALLPDAASLPPLEYDTSCRADPEVLQRLVSQAKTLRHEVQCLHERVAGRLSELESSIIGGESTQSTMHNEQVRKQLENDNLQHSLDIEKSQLDQKKKKFEGSIKTGQTELHTLQKQQMSLQQRLQERPRREQLLETRKREFDQEVMSLSRDLEKRDKEFEQSLIALTTVMETAKRHKDEYVDKVGDLTEQFHKVKLPSVPAHYLPSTTTEPTM